MSNNDVEVLSRLFRDECSPVKQTSNAGDASKREGLNHHNARELHHAQLREC